MSLVEEPLHENDQKESEIHLQKNNLTNKCDQENYKDKDVKVNDHLHMEKQMVNPLTLLKDDLFKVFKDKETKTHHEDVKSADVKTEKTLSHLSLFKEDFSHFKDDLSNVFRIGLSKEKRSEKKEKAEGTNKLYKKEQHVHSDSVGNLTEQNEDTVNAEKTNNNITDRKSQPEDSEVGLNVSEEKTETSFTKTQPGNETMGTGGPRGFFKNLFRRDLDPLKTSEKVEDSQQVQNRLSGKKEEQLDCAFRETVSEQNKDNNRKDTANQPEDSELDLNVSEETSETSFSETQKTEETMCALNTEEPPQQSDQKESEIRLQGDDLSNKIHQEDHKYTNDTKMKDQKTNQMEERTTGPLTLLTEDWLKVVKDTDTNVEREDHPSCQTGNKPPVSMPSLLKDDLSQTKEDVSFSGSSSKDKDVKSADPKTSQSVEKSMSRLSLLKDDLSNVFRIGLSKEKDNKEHPSKIKVLKTERTDEPLKNLFMRDQKLCITSVGDRQEVKIMLSEKKEEQADCGFRQNLLEQNEEKLNAEKMNNNITDRKSQPEDSEVGLNVSEEKTETSFTKTQPGNETMGTGGPRGFFKNLFRRDLDPLKTSEKVEDSQQVQNRLSGKKEEQLDCAFRETVSEQNKDNNRKDTANQPEDSELDLNVSEETSGTSFSETQQSEEIMSTGKPRGFSCPTDFSNQKPTESESAVLVGEPSQENNCTESKIRLRADDLHNRFDQEDHKDVKMEDQRKINQKENRTISTLTLLKDDFNHFKDDLLNVFRIGLSKEQLFKRDEDVACGFRGNLPEHNKQTITFETMNNSTKGRIDQPDSSELDPQSETSFSETEMSEETMCTSQTVRFSTAEDTADNEEINVEKENQPSESLPWESSGISLLSLRHANNNEDHMRGQPGGDLCSPKNFATYLTFDPNTANSELHLTDGNRTATRVWSDNRSSDHPDRFQRCPQVLCREGLLDSVYWEVEWSGGADIGIAYNSISRGGDMLSCLLGHNERSWSLECSEGSYTPCYNNTRFRSFSPEPFTHRVGVYLDWSAGTLSFYCVSQDTMVHLHTFTSTFTEPLYAGFWIWAYEGSVSLCQVELDWERLQ